MSILDILNSGSLGSALESLSNKARSATSNLNIGDTLKNPGDMGKMFGAGALGALLGNVASGSLLKNAALLGAGAVAWNFYRKWAQGQANSSQQQEPGMGGPGFPGSAGPASYRNEQALPPSNDDATGRLIARAMVYAARADGQIDPEEKKRINAVMTNILPVANMGQFIDQAIQEPLDPQKVAADVKSPEQAEDVYRLSCSVIDIDHFMEQSYLAALAQSLGLSSSEQANLQHEAIDARKALDAAAQRS